MPAHFNRGATFAEAPQLPDEPLIDQLAQTNAKVEQFDLSPDGKKLAYVSAESGGYDIYTCDIDGKNKKRIVAMYPEEALGPSFSMVACSALRGRRPPPVPAARDSSPAPRCRQTRHPR